MLDAFEPALRRLDRDGRKKFGDDWLPRLTRRRERLKTAYAALDEPDRDAIQYSSITAQAVYLFAYAPTRAEYARQFLHRHRAKLGRPLFGTPEISIVSFGGGPASELVGLIRYLEDDDAGEAVEKINYVVYDKDGEWDDVATNVINSLDTGIEMEISYHEVDAASRRGMRAIDLSQTDMVIFSYIMSELSKLGTREKISDNFREVLSNLKLNSKILFIDNLHPIFIEYFQSCKLVRGLMQKSDSGDRVEYEIDDMTGIYGTLSKALNWHPRTDLRAVSKLIVRTRL